MGKNEIDLKTVKFALNSVLDHLIDDLGFATISIEESKDLYWDCPAPELYDTTKKPSELTVGQLSDDAHFVASIKRGQSADVSYNLVHLAPLLRYIAETIQK
jgi:hypothetical protein